MKGRPLSGDVDQCRHGETPGAEELPGELIFHLTAGFVLKMISEGKLSMAISIAGE
jgi:hypothetical protein